MIKNLMEKYRTRKEAVIEFYNDLCRYCKEGNQMEHLEKLMLSAYTLSKIIRDNELNGVSNPRLTGRELPIDKLIIRCTELVDKNGTDPLVQANLLEMLSRNAYAKLKEYRESA